MVIKHGTVDCFFVFCFLFFLLKCCNLLISFCSYDYYYSYDYPVEYMLNIDIAVVSSIGKGGLRLVIPGDTSNSDHNLNRTALLGHEAEEHCHSLDNVTTLSTEKGENLVDYIKIKYGYRKTSRREFFRSAARNLSAFRFCGNL